MDDATVREGYLLHFANGRTDTRVGVLCSTVSFCEGRPFCQTVGAHARDPCTRFSLHEEPVLHAAGTPQAFARLLGAAVMLCVAVGNAMKRNPLRRCCRDHVQCLACTGARALDNAMGSIALESGLAARLPSIALKYTSVCTGTPMGASFTRTATLAPHPWNRGTRRG